MFQSLKDPGISFSGDRIISMEKPMLISDVIDHAKRHLSRLQKLQIKVKAPPNEEITFDSPMDAESDLCAS